MKLGYMKWTLTVKYPNFQIILKLSVLEMKSR